MKFYCAKTFENSKGLIIEGFQYKKQADNSFIGIYKKYILKGAKLKDYNIQLNQPLNINFDESKKSYYIDLNNK